MLHNPDMANDTTIKAVKNSIKRLVGSEQGRIKLQSSKKSFSIPIEAKLLETEGYVYLTLPLSTGIYRKDESKGLVKLEDDENAPGDLLAQIKEATKKGSGAKSKGGSAPAVPESVMKTLAGAIPAGYKLGLKDGELVFVKARAPRKGK